MENFLRIPEETFLKIENFGFSKCHMYEILGQTWFKYKEMAN